MERILYVPFDHLHRDYGVLREADPSRDVVLFVESERMLRAHRWHRQRVWFLVSAARHFAEDLRNAGYVVMYERAASTVDGISAARDRYTDATVWSAEPSSFRMTADLHGAGVQFIPNDFFLTGRSEFAAWAGSQKSLVMENFYRAQRKRLGILVDGALMGIGAARGEDRAIIAARQAIASPLLESSIEGARGVLFSIAGGTDIGLFEINAAAKLVQDAAHPEANIIFGTVIDDSMGDEVKVTVIAAGFDSGVPTRYVPPTATPEPVATDDEPLLLPGEERVPVAASAPAPRRIIFDDTDVSEDGLEVPDFLR